MIHELSVYMCVCICHGTHLLLTRRVKERHHTHTHHTTHLYMWHTCESTAAVFLRWVFDMDSYLCNCVWCGSFTLRDITHSRVPLNQVSFLTYSNEWQDSFTHATRLTRSMPPFFYVRRSTRIFNVWNLVWMVPTPTVCDMAHSRVWHDPFTCATRLIHTTYLYMRQD